MESQQIIIIFIAFNIGSCMQGGCYKYWHDTYTKSHDKTIFLKSGVKEEQEEYHQLAQNVDFSITNSGPWGSYA